MLLALMRLILHGVPACIGRNVAHKGRAGIISADRGNYIGVTFDDEKPGTISNFHPHTEGLEYLGFGIRAQKEAGTEAAHNNGGSAFLSPCKS